MRTRSKGTILLGQAAIGLVWGCGGQVGIGARDGGALQDAAESVGISDAVSPTEAGSVVSGSSDSASSGSTPTVDAAPLTTGDGAPTACIPIGGGGYGPDGALGLTQEECSSTFQEMCGGTIYQVSCSCPRASCVCFGQSTTVVDLTGCPACPGLDPGPTNIFALCGFPN
jgi:hypothetical protein